MRHIRRIFAHIKQRKHAVVYARLDNAPEVSTGEKDFLRALPDSIDIVTMRNADRLSEYDREDMKLVREDYGTKVLYYIDCTAKDKLNTSILLLLLRQCVQGHLTGLPSVRKALR